MVWNQYQFTTYILHTYIYIVIVVSQNVPELARGVYELALWITYTYILQWNFVGESVIC